MKREIYELMKPRIHMIADDGDYRNQYPDTSKECPIWYFDASGLDDENREVVGIRQAINTKNIWNAAQRFYTEECWLCENFDDIILNNSK